MNGRARRGSDGLRENARSGAPRRSRSGMRSRCSSDADHLVRLDRKAPLRVSEAVFDGRSRVRVALGAIHRLQEEVVEVETHEALRRRITLRKHELQLVAL